MICELKIDDQTYSHPEGKKVCDYAKTIDTKNCGIFDSTQDCRYICKDGEWKPYRTAGIQHTC